MLDLRPDLAEVVPQVLEHAEDVLAQFAGARDLVVDGAITAATHPDRPGGDVARYTAATAAYAALRTPWGRSEAWANLAAAGAITAPQTAIPGEDPRPAGTERPGPALTAVWQLPSAIGQLPGTATARGGCSSAPRPPRCSR